MSRESSLWDWLKKARHELGPALDMNRVENAVEEGTPDVEGYLNIPTAKGVGGVEGQFWLELKAEERPARNGPIRFKVRDKQIEWINRRWEIGANAFWLVQVGSGSERRLFLAPGPCGEKLQAGISEAELCIECIYTGVFAGAISHEDLLKRAVTCRKRFPSRR